MPDVIHVGEQAFPLVPNQTLYAIDAVSLDEAYAVAAMLNSTIAGALLVCVAERAKDAHFRYFGRTVAAMPFAAGSMGPKVDAACRFVSATGKRAAIGALGDLSRIIAGEAGTTVTTEVDGIVYAA